MATDRMSHEQDIGNLYGCPGTAWDTGEGRELLLEMIEQKGLSALTDEAVAELASLHRVRNVCAPHRRFG